MGTSLKIKKKKKRKPAGDYDIKVKIKIEQLTVKPSQLEERPEENNNQK